MNGKPLGLHKTVRLALGLTILAWATQTLLQQWGFGAVHSPADQQVRFIAPAAGAATLELRREATILGSDVTLRQVGRWSDADATFFESVADLVLLRITSDAPYHAIQMKDVQRSLRDAGVNLGAIRFAGAVACTVRRADAQPDERQALRQWADAGGRTAADAPATPANRHVPTEAEVRLDSDAQPWRTLRQVLREDLAERLRLPIDALHIQFNPLDDRLLNLPEPHFRFHIDPRRARALGEVAWDVVLITEGGTDRATITASAQAWQDQLVVVRPMATRQLITEQDLTVRRALVDRLDDEPALRPEQAIGQQTARDLKPGMQLTPRMIDAVPLVRPGQLVTVTLRQGNVQVKTVARAMENGTLGQVVRVRNESTQDVYEVVVTGQQTAALGDAGAAGQGG